MANILLYVGAIIALVFGMSFCNSVITKESCRMQCDAIGSEIKARTAYGCTCVNGKFFAAPPVVYR